MTSIAQEAPAVVSDRSTRYYLEALHHHGFTVTIQSPKTSPSGRYMVSAYGFDGEEPEAFRETDLHLHDVIKAVADRLGVERLAAYGATVAGAL
ncbi:hypothetical protein ACIBCT_20695 [Streptosporangium sp. NPDC050855]|uniref:hypothetical protein n=1 Tax=Streptosporangium sp. NPDC050855 TaxID=3366194 RepID=UPI00379011F6